MTKLDALKRKQLKKKISMVTCYDFWSARWLDKSKVDLILVGDSGAMIQSGHKSTIPADMDMMVAFTKNVAQGTSKHIVADLPFMSYRKGMDLGLQNIEKLIRAGANSVKLEGARGNIELIERTVESGIPVMGHVGLTPQFINQFGGFKVQGREQEAHDAILEEARLLEQAGAFAVVLECIPHSLAAKITTEMKIPTIGIGAGLECDGQVLVLHDLLGLNTDFKPKFVRRYLNGEELMLEAVDRFCTDVAEKQFPSPEEAYD